MPLQTKGRKVPKEDECGHGWSLAALLGFWSIFLSLSVSLAAISLLNILFVILISGETDQAPRADILRPHHHHR